MSDAILHGRPSKGRGFSLSRWRNRLIASPGFQSWASRFPLTRRIARRDGEDLFDLVAGFVHSQVLFALVELRILHMLTDGDLTAPILAQRCNLDPDRMEILLQAGAALGLLARRRSGAYGLARKGAALLGVPGLEGMILHHRAFYRDLENPVALLQGAETELARFWPYVFGAASVDDPDIADRYSTLMADSQTLVAEETLRAVDLSKSTHLLDIGGGTGAFLVAALNANPSLRATLFDLPQVTPGATQRIESAGLTDRITLHPGSFRDDPLPQGADTISLIRVLYDHGDDTVRDLLARIHATLPEDGRLVVSEPMSGGDRPQRAGDAYFALYTMAMQTGRTRSAARISQLMAEAGFTGITSPRTNRPFITSVVTGVRGQPKKMSK